MYEEYIKTIKLLFPDFTEDSLIIIDKDDSDDKKHNFLQIDSELYNGQKYVLIGDWLYIVRAKGHGIINLPDPKQKMLLIETTLNLENIVRVLKGLKHETTN